MVLVDFEKQRPGPREVREARVVVVVAVVLLLVVVR